MAVGVDEGPVVEVVGGHAVGDQVLGVELQVVAALVQEKLVAVVGVGFLSND